MTKLIRSSLQAKLNRPPSFEMEKKKMHEVFFVCLSSPTSSTRCRWWHVLLVQVTAMVMFRENYQAFSAAADYLDHFRSMRFPEDSSSGAGTHSDSSDPSQVHSERIQRVCSLFPT